MWRSCRSIIPWSRSRSWCASFVWSSRSSMVVLHLGRLSSHHSRKRCLEPRRIPLGPTPHVLRQVLNVHPLPPVDLRRVRLGLAVEVAAENVVELVLGQAAGRVLGPVDETEFFGQV